MQRGRARSIYHLEPMGSCPPYFLSFQLVRPSKGRNQDGFNRQDEYVSSAAYCCHEYIPVKYPLTIQRRRFDSPCLQFQQIELPVTHYGSTIFSAQIRPGPPSGLFPLQDSPHTMFVPLPLPYYACHMLNPSHPPRLYHTNICRVPRYNFSSLSCHLRCLWSKYSLQQLLIEGPKICQDPETPIARRPCG